MKLKITLWLCLIAGSILAADKPISGLTVFTGTPGTNDLFPFVNRADLTQSTNGSTRSITWSNLNYWLTPGFNGQQFGQSGQTNVYIKSGADQTNVLLYPSLAGNPSVVFYDTNNVQKASFNYQGGFDSSGNNEFSGTNNFTGTVLITNAASTISGNGAGLTNISDAGLSANVALLGATNQTFTGTNTFPAASFYVANSLGIRVLFTTNLLITSIPAYTATTPTNAGDSSLLTTVFKSSMPSLLSPNSNVGFSLNSERTNANAAAVQVYWYAGTATNFVLGANNNIPAAAGRNNALNAGTIFSNSGSFTNQHQGGGAPSPYIQGPRNFADTSSPWTLYMALQTGTTATNISLRVTIYEYVF